MGADGVVEKIVQRPKALDPRMMERVRGGPDSSYIYKDSSSMWIYAEDLCLEV